MAGADRHAQVLAFLADPANHGGETPARTETHGAVVFLLEDRVYKLKRAVDYGFMDFSTPAKRRAACVAEVRLNRRTAPDLYLGTQPILADGTGLRWGVLEETPADCGPEGWAETVTVMRRFESTLADAPPGESELLQLADAVAAFHEAAEPLTGQDGAGPLRAVQEGNLAFLESDGACPAEEIEALRRLFGAALERTAGRLDARARRGCVRHCHGDLHLANICRWHGRPVPFDCIEFNRDFAEIDTGYDLAFLLMDLDAHGARAGGCRLMNRYLEDRPGELGLLRALPLFLSMRAQVRAKVAFASAGAAPERAAAERAAGCAHLARARGYLEPARPLLVAVGGPSGSGKSALARALAPALGAAPGALVARSDRIRKRLWGVGETERLPAAAYETAVSRETYAEMERQCAAALADGHAAVADATFTHPESRARIEDVARRARVPFLGLWLEIDRETARTRVTARTGDASDADAAVVDAQFDAGWGAIGWRLLDAREGPDTLARAVTAALPISPSRSGTEC
jgi:aminoglycoside phosphotransferase family enzyme/predicted kinase